LKYNNKKQFGLILMVLMAIIPLSVRIAWGQTTTPLVSKRDHFNHTTGALLTGHSEKD
jgi:hypothetical protein